MAINRKNNNPFFALCLVLIVLPVLTSLSWYSLIYANLYSADTEQLVTESSIKPKFIDKLKEVAEMVTFEYYTGYSDQLEQHESLQARANNNKADSFRFVRVFFVVGFLAMIIGQFLLKNHVSVVVILVSMSLLSLLAGLLAPTLMIVGLKTVPVIDEAVVFYQSKGIYSTIDSLWSSGNLLVSIMLFLFSVLIPLVKIIVIGLGLLMNNHFSKRAAHMIHQIGKWSMADVFVVALMLSFFVFDGGSSIENTVDTKAELQVGLYFFAGFVLSSMFGTMWVNYVQKREQTSPV